MGKLIEFLTRILDWFVDLLLWVPHKLYQLVLDGLASVIEALPVPSFFENAAGWLSGISPGVMYFAESAQLGTGLTIVIGASVLRFVIRRIPVIG